jgi:hypothetical protein
MRGPARCGRVFAPASLSCSRVIEGMINELEADGGFNLAFRSVWMD